MATFGDTLKRERELREISLREISDATKINIRYLEALEQNRFDILPGGLFNKGFIRAYSTYIGVDGEAMVNCYLQELADREQGPGAGESGGPPGLHRPAEMPRRRAGSAPEHEGGNGHPLAISFAATAKGDPSAAAAANPRAASAPVAAPDVGSAPHLHSPGAVTHIEEAEPAGGPSRVLPFILVTVGGAGALFLVLSLTLKHPAPRPRPASASIAAPAVPPAPETEPGRSYQRTALASADGGPASALSGHAAPAEGESTRPSARVQVPSPQRPGLDAPAAAAMELQIETTGTTWVQLFCDDREAINWVMKQGESQSMRCLRTIRVSAADAAAARLTIGGAACAPLGEAGSRVHGFTIRTDDVLQICPPSGRGNDGRF